MLLITVSALAMSLTCSLIALGRGADTANLLAGTVAGLASGFVLVGTGVLLQAAPDLLHGWTTDVPDRLVADDLTHHGWSIRRPRTPRARLGYAFRAERGENAMYIAVHSSDCITHPRLTAPQWRKAKRRRCSYILALVDYLGMKEQQTWYVRDPAAVASASAIERAVSPPPLHRAWIDHLTIRAQDL